ncbi:hypothetical protein ABIB81_009526 [Bradyrhizobium sp. I1.7.5]
MAASDYVPIFFKNRLHLAGRPQMSTRLEVLFWRLQPRRAQPVSYMGADLGDSDLL